LREAWAQQFGQIIRWVVEGASSWGRHTAMFLTGNDSTVSSTSFALTTSIAAPKRMNNPLPIPDAPV
jgi:hypothetical protein